MVRGALSLGQYLIFRSDGTYNCELDTTTGQVDLVSAQQVSINPTAQFNFISLGNQTLPLGTVLTVIDDRVPDPCPRCKGGSEIHGTFANLPDGSTFTAGGNTFQVSCKGGDGNELTLTVVP